MAQSASEGTFLARLFIIITAIGIIVLGVYPIRGDIRKAANSAQHYVQRNLPILTGGGSGARVGSAPEPRKPAGVVIEDSPRKKVDRLTPEDRKELSELVNSF